MSEMSDNLEKTVSIVSKGYLVIASAFLVLTVLLMFYRSIWNITDVRITVIQYIFILGFVVFILLARSGNDES